MTDEQIVQALWTCHQQGDFFPDAWKGKLDLEQAYRVQLGLLDMKLAHGEQQAAKALAQAAEIIQSQPTALQLRYLQTLVEMAGEKNSTIIPLTVDIVKALSNNKTKEGD